MKEQAVMLMKKIIININLCVEDKYTHTYPTYIVCMHAYIYIYILLERYTESVVII